MQFQTLEPRRLLSALTTNALNVDTLTNYDPYTSPVANAVASIVVNGANEQRDSIQSIVVNFNEPVTAAPGVFALNSQSVQSFSAGPDALGVELPAVLPNGQYTLSINGAFLTSPNESIGGTFNFGFYRLAGDFVGSGTVGLASLLYVAQNYQVTTGFPDLLDVAQNYGRSLLAPASSGELLSTPAATLPDPTIGLAGASYQAISAPLFSGAPVYSDVVQGDLGDCYFDAVLASLARTDAPFIENDCVQCGDGSWLVGFSLDTVAIEEHLDDLLPAQGPASAPELVYNQLGPNGALWPAVYEKGFAVFRDAQDSYPNIGTGGFMDEPMTDLGFAPQAAYFPASVTQIVATMQAALSAGDALTAGVVTVNDGAPLIDDHAYAVLACTADTVTLYNPWGIAGGGLPNNGGVLTITAQQAYDDFAGLVW